VTNARGNVGDRCGQIGDVVRRLTSEDCLQWCQYYRWKTGKNSVAVVQAREYEEGRDETSRPSSRRTESIKDDGAGGKHVRATRKTCWRIDSSESIHTDRSRTTVPGWTTLLYTVMDQVSGSALQS